MKVNELQPGKRFIFSLDETIKNCEEEADRFKKTEECRIIHTECAAARYVAEQRQIAAWLRELKDARETLKAMYGRVGYP